VDKNANNKLVIDVEDEVELQKDDNLVDGAASEVADRTIVIDKQDVRAMFAHIINYVHNKQKKKTHILHRLKKFPLHLLRKSPPFERSPGTT
jgi:hypothetical protein